jgi:antitoxin (DNA-binding transcriptional repressor) of toxin-antitoxin stability system
MTTVNIFRAKSTLSSLIEKLESGQEQEVVIARHGRPVARLTRLLGNSRPRIGIAKGHFKVPDNIDLKNEAILRLFAGKRR